MSIKQDSASKDSSYVMKLAVRDMLKRLETAGKALKQDGSDVYWAAKEGIEDELLNLSIKYQVLSEKTAFIAVKDEIDSGVYGKEVKKVTVPTM